MSTTVGDPTEHNFISSKSFIWKIHLGGKHDGHTIGDINPSEQEVIFPVGVQITVEKLIVRVDDKTLQSGYFGSNAEVIAIVPKPADSQTSDQEFQRQWARTVLQLVMKQLEEDYRKQDKLAQFQQLKPFIAREEGQNYQAVADQLEMTSSAARMAASRMRDRFRLLLRQEIAQTVASEQDVDEEIQDLLRAFQA